MRSSRSIKHRPLKLAGNNPEIVVTQLLQDTMGAARRAIAVAHPKSRLRHPRQLVELDHPGRLAALLSAHLIELDNLLDAYHHAVRHQSVALQLYQIELPF
jgi:hypothetical protein